MSLQKILNSYEQEFKREYKKAEENLWDDENIRLTHQAYIQYTSYVRNLIACDYDLPTPLGKINEMYIREISSRYKKLDNNN